MIYMLDTNICIYAIKHDPEKVYQKLRQITSDEVCISSIVFSELWHGTEKSMYPEKNQLALTRFLTEMKILDYGVYAAMEYGRIRADLEKKGTPIGALDTMIAAHARSLDCTLVTNNTGEFKRVENLKIVNWAE